MDKIVYIAENVLMIMDFIICFWLLVLFLNERGKVHKIRKYIKEYNKKIKENQWYFDGEESGELRGVRELSDTYYKLQKRLAGMGALYKDFFGKFYKAIKKDERYKKMIEKIDNFRDAEHCIRTKGLFAGVRQKKKLNTMDPIVMGSQELKVRKHIRVAEAEIDIMTIALLAVFIILAELLIGYIIQFIWHLDRSYWDAVVSIAAFLIKYFVIIIPLILVILYMVYMIYMGDVFESVIAVVYVWLIWAVLFIVCYFPLAILFYYVKNVRYSFLMAKMIVTSKLAIELFVLFFCWCLIQTLISRKKSVDSKLFREKEQFEELWSEEYQDRLWENLEMLNDYIELLDINLKEAGQTNQSINDMSFPQKMSYIIRNSKEYKVNTRKLDDEKKGIIIGVIEDYQCVYATLCKPFITNGKVDVKRIKDDYDRLNSNKGGK